MRTQANPSTFLKQSSFLQEANTVILLLWWGDMFLTDATQLKSYTLQWLIEHCNMVAGAPGLGPA